MKTQGDSVYFHAMNLNIVDSMLGSYQLEVVFLTQRLICFRLFFSRCIWDVVTIRLMIYKWGFKFLAVTLFFWRRKGSALVSGKTLN